MDGKYSIELFRDGGEGAGIEKILMRHDSLTVARRLSDDDRDRKKVVVPIGASPESDLGLL